MERIELLSFEQIARVCHEANRGYCEAVRDASQLPWESAEEWQREAAIIAVQFALANPDAPSSAWRYVPVKDPAKKEHPYIVTHAALTFEQRRKNLLFKVIVAALSSNKEILFNAIVAEVSSQE